MFPPKILEVLLKLAVFPDRIRTKCKNQLIFFTFSTKKLGLILSTSLCHSVKSFSFDNMRILIGFARASFSDDCQGTYMFSLIINSAFNTTQHDNYLHFLIVLLNNYNQNDIILMTKYSTNLKTFSSESLFRILKYANIYCRSVLM